MIFISWNELGFFRKSATIKKKHMFLLAMRNLNLMHAYLKQRKKTVAEELVICLGLSLKFLGLNA